MQQLLVLSLFHFISERWVPCCVVALATPIDGREKIEPANRQGKNSTALNPEKGEK